MPDRDGKGPRETGRGEGRKMDQSAEGMHTERYPGSTEVQAPLAANPVAPTSVEKDEGHIELSFRYDDQPVPDTRVPEGTPHDGM